MYYDIKSKLTAIEFSLAAIYDHTNNSTSQVSLLTNTTLTEDQCNTLPNITSMDFSCNPLAEYYLQIPDDLLLEFNKRAFAATFNGITYPSMTISNFKSENRVHIELLESFSLLVK